MGLIAGPLTAARRISSDTRPDYTFASATLSLRLRLYLALSAHLKWGHVTSGDRPLLLLYLQVQLSD
jgi:hypothetical protein